MILKVYRIKAFKEHEHEFVYRFKRLFVGNVFFRDKIMPLVCSIMYFLWIRFAVHVFCKDKINDQYR